MASQVYLISDTYFGRSSLLKDRKHSSIKEMNNSIIDKWNSVVGEDDIVYHLGNFGWDIISTEEALHKLNGIINLIPSPTDQGLIEIFKLNNVMVIENGIHPIPSRNCVLSHFPLKSWVGKDKGVLHIHGGNKEYKANLEEELRFNVNCDLWSSTPISIDALNEVVNMVKS